MELKCSNSNCIPDVNCHEGHEDHTACKYWQEANSKANSKIKTVKKSSKKSSLPWTGEALSIQELSKLTYRSTPIIIGVVGRADAGKTTYLAMLFTLLLRGGAFKGFNFCGTKTIYAWDRLYQTLKVEKDSVVFPDPTPAEYIKFLHLALRNDLQNLKDVYISDLAGEVFSIWSQNRNDPNAENARWIYEHSNGFILFIDCDDLIKRKAQAKSDLLDLAQMLTHNLKNRPVIAVWSKSDKKTEVHQKIIEDIRSELVEKFSNFLELDISNFSSDDPDVVVHENNLKVLEWLLSKILVFTDKIIDVGTDKEFMDSFLNFKRV